LQVVAQQRWVLQVFIALLVLSGRSSYASQAQNSPTEASFQLTVTPSPGLVIPALSAPGQSVFGSSATPTNASAYIRSAPGTGVLPPMNPVKADSPVSSPPKKSTSIKSQTTKVKPFLLAKKSAKSTRPTVPHKATEAETDSEVINNILGAPVMVPPAATTPTPDPAALPAEKRFSFVSPDDAASDTAPSNSFDYGIYTYNSRLLDEYTQRVNDGVQLAQELGLPVAKKQIDELLKVAVAQRRIFNSQYPSPKEEESQKGLMAYDEARKALLDGLSLVSVSPRVEGRAIWLDRASIVQAANAEGLKTLLARLHHAGINIVYFETFNAGFPIYPSKLTQANPLIKNWDPLEVAVSEGHRLGMEIHAWVWSFAVGNRRHNELIGMPPGYPGPVLTDPELNNEALRNKHGGLAVDEHQHEFWLSPASPKARTFLLNLYTEIVTHYAVDGIHLDYIRYPFQTSGTRMGYEAAGREAYHKATGKSVDDTTADGMRLWAAWKTVQVSNFVRDISVTLRPLRPSLKISAAVFPMRRSTRLTAIQQDWETWVDHGWVDTLSPMSYTTDPQRLQTMYEAVVSSPKLHVLVYPGIALNRLDNGQLLLQLEALRDKGSLGSTLFAATHLNPSKADALGSGAFRQVNPIPPHRDLLKSMSAVLDDYQSTVNRLSNEKNPILAAPADQLRPLKRSIESFVTALYQLREDVVTHLTLQERLNDAQMSLATLKESNDAWLVSDRVTHPLRGHYLDKDLAQLLELLTYYAEHAVMPPPQSQTAERLLLPSASLSEAFQSIGSRSQKATTAGLLLAPVKAPEPTAGDANSATSSSRLLWSSITRPNTELSR
jgi:uncharacterized lipoprotein YddW (UPF0748 family)